MSETMTAPAFFVTEMALETAELRPLLETRSV